LTTVHSCKRWDIARNRYLTTRLKGTPDYITAIRGEIILNTEQDVSPGDIDKQGRYDPASRDKHTLFEHPLFHRVGGMEDSGFGAAGVTAPKRTN
jgi:hypothetical protein